jgi:hypothetical protein
MLAKRGRGVSIELVTHSNGELAESDFEAFAAQCGKFMKTICGICHDRFIIVDQKEIYWTGASLKDAGRLTFAARMLAHPSGSAFAESSLRNASHFFGAFRRWGRRSFLVFLIQSVTRRQNGEITAQAKRRQGQRACHAADGRGLEWSINRHKFLQIDMCRYVQSRGELLLFLAV